MYKLRTYGKRHLVLFLGILTISNGMPPQKSNDDKSILWFPIDSGRKVVPGILSPPKSLSFSPALANPDDIHLYLFTLNNRENYDEIDNTIESLKRSHWDVNAPVKIFAHGFSSSWNGDSSHEIRNGFITNEFERNVNLIIVQWEKLAAAPLYYKAAENTKVVGEKLTQFVNFLLQNKFTTLDKVHLLGHSLGAHAAGYAGRKFQELNPGSRIPRVTGFDPALPLFGSEPDSERLDPTDAECVDVIHTASGSIFQGELSFVEPRGTIDFYPNKGSDQPGCWPDIFGVCSHGRGYEFYSESIHNNEFTACRCNDNAWDPDVGDDFKSCSCDKGVAYMGEWTSHSAKGIYYLTTKSKSPFAMS